MLHVVVGKELCVGGKTGGCSGKTRTPVRRSY